MPTQKCAYSFVERLSRHVHPRDGRKDFCMVEAYMDESGIHDRAHVCVVAGYWGSVKKWNRFEPRWKEIIKDAGEPTMKEFHSVEFWSANGERRGVFAKWSEAKANQFINDLTDCIVSSRIFPTSAALVTEDWKKLNREERMFLTGGHYDRMNKRWLEHGAPNRLYFLPFQLALANPAMACKPGLHVHYVFDLNKQFKHHALRLFDLMKSAKAASYSHRMGSIDFENGETAVGLQAADMLAYQVYKSARERIGRNEPLELDQLNPLLRKLISATREDYQFPFLDEHGLNQALQNLAPQLRGPHWHPVSNEYRSVVHPARTGHRS